MSVDPVQGGTPNSYTYPTDPVNDFDLSGLIGWKKWFTSRAKNVSSSVKKVQNFSYRHPNITNAALILATRGRGKGGAEEFKLRLPGEPALSAKEAAATAGKLGYKSAKVSFNTRNQPVFQKGSRYISPDVDGHKGGTWKMFDLKGNRIGTYNEDLTERIGK